MDHTTLDIFRVVAAELSVTRAAKRLGRVQSNVTTRIQQLEEELGVALFRRDGNRLTLSAEGERFLGYASRMLALADEARQVLKPGEPSGTLRIGSMESTAAARLPGPLAALHVEYPEVQLRISTAPSRQLLEQVRSGQIDCAFAALPPCGDMASAADLEAAGLHGEPAFREEILLVLPPGHADVRRGADVAVRSLAAFEQGCSYRVLAEEWFGRDAPPLDIQEVGSYHSMLACVAAGGCVSLVPRSVLDLLREPPALRTHVVATVDTWLVHRSGYQTAAFDALKKALAPFMSKVSKMPKQHATKGRLK
ncbi:LysR-family transcriptional regulator PA4203 [Caballeronia glathei]|uniref:LysR family transcriptional regulator n=1 Tax=Caballeronia glathei TaxID=60547 RepID=A0A069PVD9_9BURK|nr:LysR family transcriptional regulator [Caballeronia glathei]KDR41301.1 LysR family transcriptional regulator [Caballeronia glathei]CDY78481.1 LysR-family transcriptional regulator PA4203 [Caballeronia glathei]